jgi:hypothetical protein
MDYELTMPDTAGLGLAVTRPSAFSRAKLLQNGMALQLRKNRYTLIGPGGLPVTIELKRSLLDPMPQVIVNGKRYALVEPLKWYEMAWAGLPMLLVLGGGLVGGLIGFPAMVMNARVMRSDMNPFGRYFSVAVITLLAAVLAIGLVMGTLIWMHNDELAQHAK